MKKLRTILVPVLIVTGVIAGQGAAQARSAAVAPAIAGTTTIVGSESAWMRVRLPRSIHPGDLAYEFHGDGRAIAFYLVRERHGVVPKKAPYLEGESFGQCFEAGCKENPLAGEGTSWSGKLPAGTYRLYLVTDGAPATINLQFDELEGTTTLAPSTPAQALVQTLTTRVLTEPSRSTYSAGDAAPFSGRGVAMMLQWLDPNGKGTATYGACVYDDEAPADQTTAYLPETCPSPFQDSVKGYEENEGGFGVVYGLSRLPAALGSWYTATTDVEVQGSVALWLKF